MPTYTKLPSGAVMPDGFWRRNAQTIADGWLRRCFERDNDKVITPFYERNAFVGGYRDGHTEGAGYVADATIRFSHLLPESMVGRGTQQWLGRILSSQDDDGYLGCALPENRFKGHFELWATDLLLQALICDYETRQDSVVLEAALRCGRWIADQILNGNWRRIYSGKAAEVSGQATHAITVIYPLYRLWQLSGDKALREAAVAILEDFESCGERMSSEAFLNCGPDAFREHIVGISMQIQVMIYAAELTGNERYLEAAEQLQQKLVTRGMSASGIIAGNEFTHHAGPRKWSEHCGSVEWIISNADLVVATGDVRYADAAERCMWNAYFGAKSADANLLAYNSAPNQLLATDYVGHYEDNDDQGWYRAFYSAKHVYGCCNYNTSRAFPNFVQRAAMATADDGDAIDICYSQYADIRLDPQLGKMPGSFRCNPIFIDLSPKLWGWYTKHPGTQVVASLTDGGASYTEAGQARWTGIYRNYMKRSNGSLAIINFFGGAVKTFTKSVGIPYIISGYMAPRNRPTGASWRMTCRPSGAASLAPAIAAALTSRSSSTASSNSSRTTGSRSS